MRSTTVWDVRAALQAAALTTLLFGVACLVTAATDEGGVAWGARVGRTLPLLPACGAAATFLVLRAASRRGEMLALETLGCSPARIGASFVLGGASASAVAFVLLLAFPKASAHGAIAAFFPHVGGAHVLVEPGPTFVDAVHHTRISPEGVVSPSIDAPSSASGSDIPAGARLAVALVLAAAGAGLPLVAARGVQEGRAGPFLSAAGMCALCILLFHFAAAGRVTPFLACVPAGALLIGALVRYRRASWA